MQIEKLILKNLLKTERYTRKVLPYLKPEYFLDPNDKLLFQSIADFIEQYNTAPTYDALDTEIESLKIGDGEIKAIKSTIDEIRNDKEDTTYDWMINTTEKFCKQKSVYNGIMQSIEILNGKSKTLTDDAITGIMQNALSISFDPNIGHDFFEQFDERFDYYHSVEEKIPFDLDYFNRITKHGVSRGTLNIILAGTGVGKSLAMCHFASSALKQGKNVLYITMELAEKEVAKRIDANLMNSSMDDIMSWPKSLYDQKANQIKTATNGKLIIKQYPTGDASVAHFRSLLGELKLKKNFQPDIVFIDYLNICKSANLKRGNANSYEWIKAIAEEIRGLAVEFNIPIWSATQTNRTGFQSSDVGLEDTSESFGLPATADFMVALISTEELEKMGQVMVKQLKNRYGDPAVNKRFIIGIDKYKMKLFDADPSAQRNIVDANQKTLNQVVVTNPGQPYQSPPGVVVSPAKAAQNKFKGLIV
jgi:replicative DNA helicase